MDLPLGTLVTHTHTPTAVDTFGWYGMADAQSGSYNQPVVDLYGEYCDIWLLIMIM